MGIYVFDFVSLKDRGGPPSSFNRDVTAHYTLRCTSSGPVGKYVACMRPTGRYMERQTC